MRTFGLIGKTLKHSFSKGYFTRKFDVEKIPDCQYELFEISSIAGFPELLEKIEPSGLNVTIPYKQDVIPYLNRLDESAQKVGAVNVIKPTENGWVGYNSDYYGFLESLIEWIPEEDINQLEALVIGYGGAAKAVVAVLENLKIPYKILSRKNGSNYLSYHFLKSEPTLIKEFRLIVNTTPLGMYPEISTFPDIPYQCISAQHYLYDLVYNPEQTTFMKKGLAYGAKTKNGLQMLHLQAEKSWEIWNSLF